MKYSLVVLELAQRVVEQINKWKYETDLEEFGSSEFYKYRIEFNSKIAQIFFEE